jgi:hypothetical protein
LTELVSVAAELSAAKLELSQARQQIGNLRAQLDAAMAATTERVMTAGSSTRAKEASQPTKGVREDTDKVSEQNNDDDDNDADETPRRQRQTTGSQRTVGDKEKNLAAQLEQQREAVAARTAEAEGN